MDFLTCAKTFYRFFGKANNQTFLLNVETLNLYPYPMTRNQLGFLALLAALQFSHILDYMIMMPLATQLQAAFGINAQQFTLLVSSYSIAAFVSNVAMSFFIDQFGRKQAMLMLFSGFLLGTLGCALSPSYPVMLLARVLTGLFGGLLTALVFASVGDAIPAEKRATAMGIVMAGFSAAAVLGVPMGIYMAEAWNWHFPFFFIVFFGLFVLLGIWFLMPPLRDHLARAQTDRSGAFVGLLHDRNQRRALSLSLALIIGQFSVIPLIALYMEKNMHFTRQDLMLMYLFGGLCALVVSPSVGRLADRYGRAKLFTIFCLLSVVPFFLVTHMQPMALPLVLLISSSFFIVISGRSVPANTMVVSTVAPHHRGGFMNLNASVIQLGAGLGALLSGQIVNELPSGELVHFQWVGYFAIALSLLAAWLGNRIKPFEAEPVPAVQASTVPDSPDLLDSELLLDGRRNVRR